MSHFGERGVGEGKSRKGGDFKVSVEIIRG